MVDRLYRSRHERVISGVCGGIGERFDVDPSIVRVVFVLLALMTAVFPLVVVYVLLVVAVPEEPPGILESVGFSPTEGSAGAAAWRAAQDVEWAARRAARRAERERRGTDRQFGAVVGIGLMALGAALLLDRWFQVDWAIIWPAAVVAVGIVIIAGSLRR